jgi:chromosome segregation ATPase
MNKNKQNSNNNSSSIKRGSIFSLGNVNMINDDNSNDYNKLMEKYKILLEKMSKIEEKNMKLQKSNTELKEKIKKINKNSNNPKISISDDSNNFSNANDIGKLSIMENNFEGEGDIIGKLNNKNEREQEYFESMYIELEATKNQLKVVKEIFKEMEKKYETVKKICENLFSRITLKKQEKEEFKILLKVMDFTDEQIALIIDKRKK